MSPGLNYSFMAIVSKIGRATHPIVDCNRLALALHLVNAAELVRPSSEYRLIGALSPREMAFGP